MENVFDLISRSVSNQQDIIVILLFVDLQSFGNFDWFPSLGPQPLNSSKFYGLQTLFQSAQVHSVSFVSFWLSKCPFFTKERCRKHQKAMFSMENRDNSHRLEMYPTKLFRIRGRLEPPSCSSTGCSATPFWRF